MKLLLNRFHGSFDKCNGKNGSLNPFIFAKDLFDRTLWSGPFEYRANNGKSFFQSFWPENHKHEYQMSMQFELR